MNLKLIKEFYNGSRVLNPGAVLKADNKLAEYLISKGIAEEIKQQVISKRVIIPDEEKKVSKEPDAAFQELEDMIPEIEEGIEKEEKKSKKKFK